MDLIRHCRVSLSLYVMICVCSRLQLAPKRCSHPESYLLLRHRSHTTVVTSFITLHFRYLQDSPPSFQERERYSYILCIQSDRTSLRPAADALSEHAVRLRNDRTSIHRHHYSLASEAAAPTAAPSSSVRYLRYMKVGPLSMVHHLYLLVNCN